MNKVPADWLNELYTKSRVVDTNQGKSHKFEQPRDCFIVKQAIEYYSNGHISHSEIKVRNESNQTILYKQNIHNQDKKLTTTAETHTLFLQRFHLYLVCVDLGTEDLKTYLCNDIGTAWPIYEAEIIAMFQDIHSKPDILRKIDPCLCNYIFCRANLFQDELARNNDMKALLDSATTAKELHLFIAPCLDEASSKRALEACGMEEAFMAKAQVDLFMRKLSHAPLKVSQSAYPIRQPSQPVMTSQQAADNNAHAEDVRAHAPSNDHLASTVVPSGHQDHQVPGSNPQTQPDLASSKEDDDEVIYVSSNDRRHPSETLLANGTTHSTATQSQKRGRSPSPNVTPTNRLETDTKERRPFSFKDIYEQRPQGGQALVHARPSIPDQYWSITPEAWSKLPDRFPYTHAGYICETELGMIAHERCNECAEHDAVCEVYKEQYRTRRPGLSCARCRIATGFRPCSHIKRMKANGSK